jgi:deazaflavin-dependent oxidoreductase (nitroreductase family)
MVLEGKRPNRLWKFLFKVPLLMYNIGIRGWERLIKVQFMKITTKGRRTGKPHSVLVDVINHDVDNDVYYVSSAYGAGADWMKNIKVNPVFDAQVWKRKFKAVAEQVTEEIGRELLFNYIDEHRYYVNSLYKMIGTDLAVLSEKELKEILGKEMVLAIKPQ